MTADARCYAVFISYRHSDNREMGRKWANWLHEALESYEVPSDLIGTTNQRGEPVPASLYPVFRDEEELPADADLSLNIRRALENSGLLVVLCSPRAVASRFVADEIRYFKELGQSHRILALIIDGEPNASDDPAKREQFGPEAECFPEPLRFGVPAEDDLKRISWDIRTEPIAADVRPAGRAEQGWTTAAAYREHLNKSGPGKERQREEDAREYGERLDLAKLKIVAGALGLPLGVLTQRDKAQQVAKAKRRAQVLRRWLIAVGGLALITLASAFWAWRKQNDEAAATVRARQAQSDAEERHREADTARQQEADARGKAEQARTAATEAAHQTKVRASKADTDIALELASRGEDAHAMALAVRALELNEGNRMAAILAFRLLTDGHLVLPEHLLSISADATALAFSRDGNRLAAGCEDGTVSVIDLSKGEKFALDKSLNGPVQQIAFCPDGSSVAAATKTNMAVWDYGAGGKAVMLDKGFTGFDVLVLSWPMADRLVLHSRRTWGSGFDLTVVFGRSALDWKVIYGGGDIGKDLLEGAFHDEEDRRKMVPLNGSKAWVADSRGLLVFRVYRPEDRLIWLDLHSPDIKKPKFTTRLPKNADEVFIAKGNGIAAFVVPSQGDKPGLACERWDPLLETRQVNPIAFDGADRICASGDRLLFTVPVSDQVRGGGIRIVDTRTGKTVVEHLKKQDGLVLPLAFGDSGKSWVLRSKDRTQLIIGRECPNSIKEAIINLPARFALSREGYSGNGKGLVVFDPSERWLAVATEDKCVRVWPCTALTEDALSISSPTSPEQVRAGKVPSNTAGFELEHTGEDWDKMVYTVFQRDALSGKRTFVSRLEKRSDIPKYGEENAGYTGHAFSPDGSRLALSYGSTSDRPDNNAPSVAILYESSTGRIIGQPMRHDDDVFSPCFAPDGKWLITASDDGTVRRWSSETGLPIGNPLRFPSRIRSVEVSPSGDLIITSTGHLIDVGKWSVSKVLTPISMGLGEHRRIAYFSPDGLWLATVSGGMNYVDYAELNQWEISSGRRIGQPIGMAQNTDFHWLTPGESLVSEDLIWQCAPPGTIGELLPLLRACQPLRFNEKDELVTNDKCSARSLSIDSFFPAGRNEKNAVFYDIVRKILRSP